MKQLIFSIFFIFLTVFTQSQWISSYGGANTGDMSLENAKGTALAIDGANNCFVTGYCNNGITGNDILVIKYDINGDTILTRTYNGSDNSDDAGYGIAIDGSGNIYVIGTSSSTGRSHDLVLLKYDTSGELLWDKSYSLFNGFADDRGMDIKLDNSGNIFVTGYGTKESGYSVMITQKYKSDGTLLWTNFEDNSAGNSKGLVLDIDNSGYICVTGYIPNGITSDIVLLKYDTEGNTIFRKTSGIEGEDKAWGIAVDEEDNIIITGFITNSANNNDAYIAKYDPIGNLLWSQAYNGTGNSEDKAWGIAVDEEDSPYITGSTTDALGNINFITLKYSSAGQQLWAQSYDGTGGGRDVANAIGLLYEIGSASRVVVAGESWGTNNNFDFATVSYNAISGTESSVSRYSLNEVSDDIAQDIAISTHNGRIYVTGYSEIIIESRFGGSFLTSIMYPPLNSDSINTDTKLPSYFALNQNFPNPFNPSTKIKFSIPVNANVKLVIYDMLGKTVEVLVDKQLGAGDYTYNFVNNNLSSGIYFYELTAGSLRDIKKMTLIK